MSQKLLSPLIVSILLLVIILGSFLHIFYGNPQTSKWHYMTQVYLLPKYLPTWMIKAREQKILGEALIISFVNTGPSSARATVTDYSKMLLLLSYHLYNNSTTSKTGFIYAWHPNGQLLYSGRYVKGKEEGLHQFWQQNGKLDYVGNFSKGLLNGKSESWADNGTKIFSGTYQNHKPIGKHESWFKNGAKSWVGNYSQEKPIGKHIGWYANGSKNWIDHFNDHGELLKHEYWHFNGQRASIKLYKAGKVISTTHWNIDGSKKAEKK